VNKNTISRRGFLYGAGTITAGVTATYLYPRLKSKIEELNEGNSAHARETVFGKENIYFDPLPSAEDTIIKYESTIGDVANRYSIPEDLLKHTIRVEIGPASEITREPRYMAWTGHGTVQRAKAQINKTRLLIFDDTGDMAEDGKEHLGHSFGLLNLKPGLITKAVVDNIDDNFNYIDPKSPNTPVNLKQVLKETYNEELKHADDKMIEYLSRNFEISLELVAANLNLWWGEGKGEDFNYPWPEKSTSAEWEEATKYILMAKANGSYTCDKNRLYIWLPDLVPEELSVCE